MSNVALHKKLEEKNVRNPEAITDGNSTNYGPRDGYSAIRFPGYFTIDLEECYKIFCIRFLLWDGKELEPDKSKRAYKYQLLISKDYRNWTILYDNIDEIIGTKGWQEFKIPDGIELRYIRIFGLHNTFPEFHIVELEAYDTLDIPTLNKTITIEQTISEYENLPTEKDIHLPIKKEFEEIENSLKDFPINFNFNGEKLEIFDNSMAKLRRLIDDIAAIEANHGKIRRQILDPVQDELKLSSKISKWGFWIGVISLFLSIIIFVIQSCIKINFKI